VKLIKNKNMATLYEIEQDLLDLFERIEDNEGEISKEDSEKLEITQGQLESKSIAYLSIIRDAEATITQIETEEKRLAGKKKRNKDLIDYLKSRLLNAVNLFGDEEKGLEVGLHTFKKRKSTSVTIEDADLLASEFVVIKKTTSPNKKAIKEALNNKKEVKGASLSTNYSLNID
jgi:hypothetical protein